jgi:hypothetical protein
LRVTLARLGNRETAILLTWHHIVSDGWSNALFHKELSEAYQAVVAQTTT